MRSCSGWGSGAGRERPGTNDPDVSGQLILLAPATERAAMPSFGSSTLSLMVDPVREVQHLRHRRPARRTARTNRLRAAAGLSEGFQKRILDLAIRATASYASPRDSPQMAYGTSVIRAIASSSTSAGRRLTR